MKRFTVLDLLDLDLKEHNALNLTCIGGRAGLTREITEPDMNRPGLSLSGFFEELAYTRIQIFGRGEGAYLEKLEQSGNLENVKKMFSYPIPCCIFTHDLSPGKGFLDCAEEGGCPVLKTDLSSSHFSARIIRALNDIFAPQKTVHGVLVEVFGIGVLIMGESGVGKASLHWSS